MITAIDTVRAISERLRDLGYKIKDVDITKEIPRPCLVVEAEELKSSHLTQYLQEETNSFVVYYFAEYRETGYAELLHLKQELQSILMGPLEISDGFYVTVDELESEINKRDMALSVRFDVYTVQDYAAERDEELEVMEELILEGDGIDGTWDA